MKTKVCGIKSPLNAREIAALRPQFMGFIFHPASPRHVTDPTAAAVTLDEGHVRRVGVFVNPDLETVLDRVGAFHLDYVQLHGDEDPGFCATVAGFVPVIKAFRVDDDFAFAQTTPYESMCDLFVFDAKGKYYGGNGHKYDWSVMARYEGSTPFLLSGGIGPEDSAAVREFSHPMFAGVDLNSGFETAPGEKDPVLLRQFFDSIQAEKV